MCVPTPQTPRAVHGAAGGEGGVTRGALSGLLPLIGSTQKYHTVVARSRLWGRTSATKECVMELGRGEASSTGAVSEANDFYCTPFHTTRTCTCTCACACACTCACACAYVLTQSQTHSVPNEMSLISGAQGPQPSACRCAGASSGSDARASRVSRRGGPRHKGRAALRCIE